jgi:hypothetical protein
VDRRGKTVRLPGLAKAVVPEEKILGYLLSASHPVGRFKARFFAGLGFTRGSWQALAQALLTHAEEHEIAESDDTEFGTRYAVDGPIETPEGRRPRVRVVWFVERGGAAPRLVTAYPLREGRER